MEWIWFITKKRFEENLDTGRIIKNVNYHSEAAGPKA